MVGSNPREEASVSTVKFPVRYWRWMWLGEALRILLIPLVLMLAGLVWTLRKVAWAIDQSANPVVTFRYWCLEQDKAHSGWKPPPPPRAPALELSPRWKEKLGSSTPPPGRGSA